MQTGALMFRLGLLLTTLSLVALAASVVVSAWFEAVWPSDLLLGLTTTFFGALLTVFYVERTQREHEDLRWSQATDEVRLQIAEHVHALLLRLASSFGVSRMDLLMAPLSVSTDIKDLKRLSEQLDTWLDAHVLPNLSNLVAAAAAGEGVPALVNHLRTDLTRTETLTVLLKERLEPSTLSKLLVLRRSAQELLTVWETGAISLALGLSRSNDPTPNEGARWSREHSAHALRSYASNAVALLDSVVPPDARGAMDVAQPHGAINEHPVDALATGRAYDEWTRLLFLISEEINPRGTRLMILRALERRLEDVGLQVGVGVERVESYEANIEFDDLVEVTVRGASTEEVLARALSVARRRRRNAPIWAGCRIEWAGPDGIVVLGRTDEVRAGADAFGAWLGALESRGESGVVALVDQGTGDVVTNHTLVPRSDEKEPTAAAPLARDAS